MTRCLIEGISHDGQGVARIEGLAVFVPGALPGETVDVKVTQRKRKFGRAQLKSILEASPHRAEPPCPYYGECGGCDYQHASYALQLELKTEVVRQTLLRIGKIDTTVNLCLPSPKIWRYRNKVSWHARPDTTGWRLGYYRSDTRNLLGIEDCRLISQAMQEVSNTIGKTLPQLQQPGPSLEVTVRESSYEGQMMVILDGVKRQQSLRLLAGLKQENLSLLYNEGQETRVLSGQPFLYEKLHDFIFKISPLAFFQVNHGQTQQLLGILIEWLKLQGDEEILDAYCGVGTLALPLARQARKVMGIEAYKPAVKDAQSNARLNGLRNTRFLAGSTEEILPTLTHRFDAVIIDPPRSGCTPQVVRAIARLKIPRVVYVSCEPSTLARDLALFEQAAYGIEKVQPLDMFPWTRHVECVVLMSRNI